MKKLILGSLTFLFVLGMVQFVAVSATNKVLTAKETGYAGKYSKTYETGNVKAATKRKFNADFGSIPNVIWEKSKTLDKVTFVRDGYKMVAYYNSHSRLVGTGSAGTMSGMSGQTLAGIKTMYKDYSIGSVIFFDNNEANITSKLVYGIRLKEENYLVELSSETRKIIVRVNVIGGKTVINQI